MSCCSIKGHLSSASRCSSRTPWMLPRQRKPRTPGWRWMGCRCCVHRDPGSPLRRAIRGPVRVAPAHGQTGSSARGSSYGMTPQITFPSLQPRFLKSPSRHGSNHPPNRSNLRCSGDAPGAGSGTGVTSAGTFSKVLPRPPRWSRPANRRSCWNQRRVRPSQSLLAFPETQPGLGRSSLCRTLPAPACAPLLTPGIRIISP